jgi:Methyltransferase domain
MLAASSARPAKAVQRVHNRQIVARVLAGTLGRSIIDRTLRGAVRKALWIELKRFGAPHVRNIEVAQLLGIGRVTVEGAVVRQCPLVLAALAKLLECETVFEFGTYLGETSWLLAHNRPGARVFTLDFPGLEAARRAELDVTDPEYFATWDRGARFRGTPEAERITQLFGDSATFDFAPFRGRIDLVYVDASHSYSYARSDTEAALGMLSATGTIVWDDYTYYPGLWGYLNALAPSLDRPIYHLLGTRLAVYSRRDIVAPARS